MDEIEALTTSVCTNLCRRYGGFVEAADVRQELWVAYFTSKYYLDGHGEPDEFADEEAREEWHSAFNELKRELRRAGERYCRREKAARSGYEPHDEAFYNLAAMRQLVAAYLAHGPTESPPRTYETSVSRTGMPGETGTWLTSLIDVGIALGALKPTQRALIVSALGPDNSHMSDAEIASLLHMDEDRFRARVGGALTALQRWLGGANPYRVNRKSREEAA